MIGNIYNKIDFYKKALDGTWEKHKAISNNMANVNTPNYKRKIISFEEQLKATMKSSKLNLTKTHENHINTNNEEFSPKVLQDKTLSYRMDGNNVNIDTEAAELAKNSIMYDALIKQVMGEFEKVKNVITEGSK